MRIGQRNFPDTVPARNAAAAVLLWILLTLVPTHAQIANAPPRNVDDVFALLAQYPSDPEVARKQAFQRADSSPPEGADKLALAQFYDERATAANDIGRLPQALADLQRALDNAPPRSQLHYRIRQQMAFREHGNGNLLRALKLSDEAARTIPRNYISTRIASHARLSNIYRDLGDFENARTELSKAEQAYGERGSYSDAQALELERTAHIEFARAAQLESEGKFAEAEQSRRKAIHATRQDRKLIVEGRFARNPAQVAASLELSTLFLAKNLGVQGKLVEAEGLVRDTLAQTLARVGTSHHVRVGNALRYLAETLLAQGRYAESERVGIGAIATLAGVGADERARVVILARRALGAAQVGQAKWSNAIAEYEKIAEAVGKDAFLASRYQTGNINWGLALVKSDQASKAVPMLEALSKTTSSRLGDAADESAQTRGVLAMALAASGNRERALAEFRRALPVLLSYSGGDGDEENGGVVRATRLRYILEAYIDLLTWQQQAPDVEAIAESFRVADAARGSSVQRALFESTARASITDTGLATIVREEQDARVRLGVLTSLLGRLLSAPQEDQLPKVIAGIRTEIENLRAQRVKLKSEIEKRFPSYANLVDPKPATLQQVRTALKLGEALISVYVGTDKTYVWAVPRNGAPAFAAVPLGDKALMESVTRLRKALDIGNTALARFPRFDTAIAHRLYNELLKPVEAGWKDATSLIIVPHRALGQLPFSLLVTAPADIGVDTAAQFDSYRAVPWLLRKASITQLPSVNALTTLRALPAAAGNRREFIGFGDPYFSRTQQAEAASQERIQVAALSTNLRNLRIDQIALPMSVDSEDSSDSTLRNAPKVANSSTLAQLARLPETADEIRDIAQALKADMTKDIFLGVNANEKNVKSMNLADRKVIAFATHGLVPGDLNGLEQPALALTAPEVAGIDGDGLLTMEEILALKLNADWVVLSACNTGSGDGAGSEAVSGLGRAFFYAGARSLLVSNWPVETLSAKLLTTDVFKRSMENPALTRAEALRQTMLWLMDNAGQRDASGKVEFTYAHPMFWAPFALIGDGGR
jgi:CHAT domain-containing protein